MVLIYFSYIVWKNGIYHQNFSIKGTNLTLENKFRQWQSHMGKALVYLWHKTSKIYLFCHVLFRFFFFLQNMPLMKIIKQLCHILKMLTHHIPSSDYKQVYLDVYKNCLVWYNENETCNKNNISPILHSKPENQQIINQLYTRTGLLLKFNLSNIFY